MKQFFSKYKSEFIVFAIFTLITAIFFGPVLTHFKSFIYGTPGDPFYNLWMFKNLTGTNLSVNYPFGLENPGHILIPNYPILNILGKFLTYLFSSEIAAYNFIIFISFPLSGLAIYLILKELIKDKYASFLGGLIFAFSAYHFARAQVHINLTSIYWLAFDILLLIKIYKYSRLKDYIIFGVLLAITLLDHYQYGLAAGLCTLAFISFTLIYKPKDFKILFLKRMLFSFLIALSVTVTFAPWLIQGDLADQSRHFSFRELQIYSARWFNYLLPAPSSQLFGQLTNEIYTSDIKNSGSNITEETLFLGWVSLVIFIAGIYLILKNRKTNLETFQFSIIFLTIALLGLIFSFAPEINILGLKLKTPAYYIFNFLPVFRVYSRFGILVMLAISLLSAISFYYLLKTIKKGSLAITIIFSLLILTESLQNPFAPYTDVSANALPQIYTKLGKEPVGPLAEYPLLSSEEPKSYDYLLAQIYHQFPLLYGSPQDSDGDKLRKEILNPSKPATIDRLQLLQVKYIIIHKDKYTYENARKYPGEYNNGQIPSINDPRLKLISSDDQSDLYLIK